MQIVIDIPDSLYENILICWENIHPKVWKILKDGTVLPKNHGRLIDGDAIITEAKEKMKYPLNYKYMECVIAHMNLAPTIIEADKDGDTDGNRKSISAKLPDQIDKQYREDVFFDRREK